MKKKLLTISAYISIGVVFTVVMAAQRRVPPMNSSGYDKSADSHNQYTEVKAGKGFTKDGVQASFQTYVSDKGITVFTRIEFFRSSSDMATQFEANVQKLSDIIERGYTEESKESGGISRVTKGERIVGKRAPDEGQELYCIWVTNDTKISYIEAVSLDTILDFEQVFNRRRK